jgi:hypothetical protein
MRDVMKIQSVVFWTLWAAGSSGCGGAGGGAPVSAVDYKGGEMLNPRLGDGRPVHLGYERHHPECFVFAAGSEERTEEVECPEAALRLEDCPGGLVYRSKTQPDCVCVPAGGEEPRRMNCP